MMNRSPAIKVMLVDYDADFVGLLRLMLHSFGDFDIRPASNEAEALYLLEGFKPDITVIDIAASHLDGTQILQRIRQRDIDARILIVTTMQPESIAEYINQSQHTDYLCKANPIPEIRSEIQRHIETLVPSYRL